MSGESSRTAAMARRVRLPEWRGTNTLGVNLFVAGFRLGGGEIEGLRLYRSRVVPVPNRVAGTHTMWVGDGNEALLRVDHYEASSREGAHDLLVEILANVESPLASRPPRDMIGDVAFIDDDDNFALFARGNVVVFSRRAGRNPVPVHRAARDLDTELITLPPAAESVAVPWTAAAPQTPGDRAGLVEPLSTGEWLQVLSTTGRVTRDQGRLVYEQSSPGPADVRLYRRSVVVPDGPPTDGP